MPLSQAIFLILVLGMERALIYDHIDHVEGIAHLLDMIFLGISALGFLASSPRESHRGRQ